MLRLFRGGEATPVEADSSVVCVVLVGVVGFQVLCVCFVDEGVSDKKRQGVRSAALWPALQFTTMVVVNQAKCVCAPELNVCVHMLTCKGGSLTERVNSLAGSMVTGFRLSLISSTCSCTC